MAININDLDNAISKELNMYSDDVTSALKKQTQRSIKELVETTKATAPVGNRTKHYRDNITSRKESESSRGVSHLWYVKGSDYRLSHLLENGHQQRDGSRYEGTHFIAKALTPILAEYENAIERIIKNGK